MSDQQSHKAHRASQSGKKAEKKDVAQGKDKTGGHKGFNEKVSDGLHCFAGSDVD